MMMHLHQTAELHCLKKQCLALLNDSDKEECYIIVHDHGCRNRGERGQKIVASQLMLSTVSRAMVELGY